MQWIKFYLLLFILKTFLGITYVSANNKNNIEVNNFGLPGTLDLPSGYSLNDGELIVTQQVHSSLARTALSFQLLPNLGFVFRYSGHGNNGREAFDRINHDRSFDTHLTLSTEGKYLPGISIGLRDFIGTGWYSSEYIVGTKAYGDFGLTFGVGFGRLNGRNSFSNPLGELSSRFKNRVNKSYGRGGTFGSINWFQGDVSPFFSAKYRLNERINLLAEYTPDQMSLESSYIDVRKPWNIGANFKFNDYISVSTQFLHGSTLSISSNLKLNPSRPPFNAGNELAPVPMRLPEKEVVNLIAVDREKIIKVLEYDQFTILGMEISSDTLRIDIVNHKFRSIAQAIGRVSSTLQRFTNDDISSAIIVFHKNNLQVASYKVELEQVAFEQFGEKQYSKEDPSIYPKRAETNLDKKVYLNKRFKWSLGPYFTHRLFNPDLPLSAEVGAEFSLGYKLSSNLELSGALRKSLLTNLTDNHRRSNSVLPHVHSDWPLYDIAGQHGHVNDLSIEYNNNLGDSVYGRFHAGILEPFYAGIGGEILYKPTKSPVGLGIDIHRVRKRDFDMMFNLLDYETTIGHVSLYYDAGGMFDLEINAGRYLAGDVGATTKISRIFGNGWEVGAYATFTDVPFETFGEGSFDKGIYAAIPIDWLIGTPNQRRRKLAIRPITRDGGAQLESARNLYYRIRFHQNSQFLREKGRLWK